MSLVNINESLRLLDDNDTVSYDTNYNAIINSQDDRLIKCTICLERMYINDTQYIFATDCDHYFHTKCIVKWLKDNNTCPICRNRITINLENNKDNNINKIKRGICGILTIVIFILMLLSWSHVIYI
jgi:hypothetical protein